MKTAFGFNHNTDYFPHQRRWWQGPKPRALFCLQLSMFVLHTVRAHVFSPLCSFLNSCLAHRMPQLMQPSSFCRSCFVLITPQVFFKCLPCASPVLGAKNITMSKADRNPPVPELHLRIIREGAQRNAIWALSHGSQAQGKHLEGCSSQRE